MLSTYRETSPAINALNGVAYSAWPGGWQSVKTMVVIAPGIIWIISSSSSVIDWFYRCSSSEWSLSASVSSGLIIDGRLASTSCLLSRDIIGFEVIFASYGFFPLTRYIGLFGFYWTTRLGLLVQVNCTFSEAVFTDKVCSYFTAVTLLIVATIRFGFSTCSAILEFLLI